MSQPAEQPVEAAPSVNQNDFLADPVTVPGTPAQHVRVAVFNPSQYAKPIFAVVAAIVVALSNIQGPLTTANYVQVAVIALGALGTFIPNRASGIGRYLNTAVTAVAAGLTALLPYLISGGLNRNAILLVIVAVLKAAGVFILPNAGAITYNTHPKTPR